MYTAKTESILKTLGPVEGEDFIVLQDGSEQIVVKYVSVSRLKDSDEANKEDATRWDWICDHVASHTEEEIRARVARRPLLQVRLISAITMLYGAASESDLGKVVL